MHPLRPFPLAALALAALCLGPAAARADDAAKPDAAKKDEAPPTAVAEKGPFTIVLEGSGVFEPVGAAEVACEPQAYGGELKVVEAAAPGPVSQGQVLVRFDTEKIDEQLATAAKDLEIARRALATRREDSKRAEEGGALALERAEKEKAAADEALALFSKVGRELRVKESEHRLQGSRDSIQDQEEELAQLKKMYKSDDVVEETEEIVMKRAQRGLARSKAWLGYQEQHHKDMVEVELPREQQNLELAAKRTAFDLSRLQATTPIAVAQSGLELAKAELALDRQEAALGKLKADRERLTVTSPATGLAVPGTCVRGKWANVDETARSLVAGETLRAKQPIFTVLRRGAVVFRVAVPEASILSVKPGQPVEIASAALGEGSPLSAKVSRIAPVSADGSYDVEAELSGPDERLMPGFTGKAKIRTGERPDAVTVPAGAVVVDGEKKSVHVWADGKSAPRAVKAGATSGGRTEITDGLKEGEKVLTSPPKP